MRDYSKGKIYCVRSNKTDLIYIGSTIQPLYKRFNVHKTNYKRYIKYGKINTLSYKIFELDDTPYIELITNYPCSCLDELNREEGKYIRSMDCVNKNIPGRTIKEWRDDNREHIKEYYEANKAAIQAKKSQKFTCPCGGKYTKENKTKHEESIKHKQFIKSE